jgi:hypothetical protein
MEWALGLDTDSVLQEYWTKNQKIKLLASLGKPKGFPSKCEGRKPYQRSQGLHPLGGLMPQSMMPLKLDPIENSPH